jgi:hypothetical protein
MKGIVSGGTCLASILAFGVVVFAQSPAAQSQPGGSSSADQAVKVTGCVQQESEYRKAHDAGKGGVVGTGVGAGNEFILIDASAAAGASGGGSQSGMMAYELSGAAEGQLSKFVNRRVEIEGRLKAAEVSGGGQPTGGPTAGTPPRGVDVGGEDLKLREIEVVSVREATGSCSAK